MLGVHKSSWHYKLAYNKLSDHIFNQKEPKDLCTYMRQVFKPMFWFATLLLAICGSVYDIHMLSLYGAEDWVWPVSVFAGLFLLIISALGWALMIIIVIVTFIAIVIIVIHFFLELVWEPFKARREENHEDKEPEPNLFWEWCKAQKQRVCPLIEVVD